MIGDRLVRESFSAMGTECVVAATASRSDDRRVRRALLAGRHEVEACEEVLSRFRPASDLSRLNDASGAWLRVDRRLLDVLRVALRVREETHGMYDPAILPALVAAGYDRSFELLNGRLPATPADWRSGAAVELDLASSRVRVEPGAALDLGGIGKGFAAASALWAMREAWLELPGALVDLGGDIAVWGRTPEGGPWGLAVADPRTAGSTLATIEINEGAVATSGRDRRRFGPGRQLHHLIDPATGAPAETGPLAVTVAGIDAGEVEAYATALAVTPVADAAALLSARPRLAALIVPFDRPPFVVGALPLTDDSPPLEVLS